LQRKLLGIGAIEVLKIELKEMEEMEDSHGIWRRSCRGECQSELLVDYSRRCGLGRPE
jgi:hypothetical protein